MHNNTLEEQHKRLGESGQDILLAHTHLTGFSGITEVLPFSYPA
jgi:hypothetical protein